MSMQTTSMGAFETGSELRQGLVRWIEFYNARRPHSEFAGRTPNEVYLQIATTPSPGHAPETRPSSWRHDRDPGLAYSGRRSVQTIRATSHRASR